jgi:hypothetical protein
MESSSEDGRQGIYPNNLFERVVEKVRITPLSVNPHAEIVNHQPFSMQNYTGDYHLTAFTERLMRFYLWETGYEIETIDIKDEWLFRIEARKVVDYSFQDLIVGGANDRDFVHSLYQRALGRDADPDGFAGYLNELASGGTTREKMVKSLLLSEEKQEQMTARCPAFALRFHEAQVPNATD